MIQLHYFPSNASMTPHMVLEELGVPYELVLVDRTNNAHHSPEYLKLNPNGKIPVLVDGELVLYETAAITLHLADTHAGAGLAPDTVVVHGLGVSTLTLVERDVLGRGLVRLLAVRADLAEQALPDDTDHRRGDEERLDAHVEEAVECGDRVGAVQR